MSETRVIKHYVKYGARRKAKNITGPQEETYPNFEEKEEFCWRHDTSAKTYRISEPAGKSRGKKALLAGQRFF